MSISDEWAQAYAKQARADLAARQILFDDKTIPSCQQLHFLQMACEKLAKAHLCKYKADPKTLQFSHAYIAKNLPIIARQQFSQMTGKQLKDRARVLKQIRNISREIELLAPAVDDAQRRPDNCEYPWEDNQGKVHVPAEYSFPNLSLLYQPAGRLLLKILTNAIERFS